MLAFLTGAGFGAAAGWFAYVRRDWLVMLLLVNGGAAVTIIFLTVVLPSSSAAGSVDMTLWEFTLFVLERVMNDVLASMLVWFVVAFTIANIVTWVAYKGFEPLPEIVESRTDKRRRIEAEMKYRDSYFD